MERKIGAFSGIMRINLLFLFTSFFTSGTQSMVSQVFFASYYPDQKYALLSLTLFLGALATLAGLLAGASMLRARPRALALFMPVGIAGFVLQLLARSIFLYLPVFVIASFSINLLFNAFDNFFMRVVDPQARRRHIRVLLLNQMLGYILSPLFFSFFFEQTWLCITVILVLGIVSYYPAFRLLQGVSASVALPAGKGSLPLERVNRVFLSYILLTHTGIYIFLAIAEYLLRDAYQYENSSLVCAIFLMIVILISCVVIAAAKSEEGFALGRGHILSAPLIAAAAFILMLRLSTHPAYLIAPCIFLGVGNGLFLSGTKRYANCCEQRTRVISLCNIFQTIASLCAYLATFLVSRLGSPRAGLDANTLNLSLIIATMALATLLFLIFTHIQKKEEA